MLYDAVKPFRWKLTEIKKFDHLFDKDPVAGDILLLYNKKLRAKAVCCVRPLDCPKTKAGKAVKGA
ncbi:hypothetical protein [Intestinimonas butyriciproducens]|uniref:hypothetical protein n=1 Tax=Intestinimonas butyriciproducens TaxID=1297617 RepID=UPI003AF1C8BA